MHPGSPIKNHDKHPPAQTQYLPHTACTQRSGSESISSACTGQAHTVVVCQAAEVTQECKRLKKCAMHPFLPPEKNAKMFDIILTKTLLIFQIELGKKT